MAVRVGTVQHQHVDLGFCAGFHDEHECAHICVKPRPHVLDVEDDHVDAVQLRRLRLSVGPMQAENVEACGGVCPVFDVCAVGRVTPEPMLRRKDVFHFDPERQQGVHKVGAFRSADHAGVVGHHGDGTVLEQRNVVGGPGVAQSLGLGREAPTQKRPHQPQFLHEFEDALGDGGVGLGAGDVVNHSASFSWKHGVKSFQKFRVVVEHVLQILGDGHAILALVHGQIHMHPAAKSGLGGFDFGLGHRHEPTAIARGQEPAMPSHGVVHCDDVTPVAGLAHRIHMLGRDGEKMPRGVDVEAFNLGGETPSGVLTHDMRKVREGRMRALHSAGRSMATTHSPKATNSMPTMRGASSKTGTAST